MGAARADAGEVVAHAAATAHGFRSLVEGRVDADLVAVVRDAVADRLHEAVDQGGLELGPGRGIDATAEYEPVHLGAIEDLLPACLLLRLFDRSERARHAAAHGVGRA